MRQYMTVAPDGRVDALYDRDDEEVAPEVEGFEVVEVARPFTNGWPSGPTETSALHWVDGAMKWVETAPLADVIARARDQIDAAGEALRQAVVNKRPLKGEEYAQAEAQARAWRESGYAGDPPRDVASWAAAKWRDGMTAREAADDILAQADQYRTLLSDIRETRLARMEDARHATTTSEAQAALATFSSDMSSLTRGPA